MRYKTLMRKTIAIQVTNVREESLLADKQALYEIGIEPIYFGLIPFSDEVTGADSFDSFDEVITFGPVKALKLWQRGLMPKSSIFFYDRDAFDQWQYRVRLGKHLLNYDASYARLGSIKNKPLPVASFVKPTSDLKAFAGIQVEAGGTVAQALSGATQDNSLSDDELILIAPLHHIAHEYRSFVVNGEIVDTCSYRSCGRLKWDKSIPDEKKAIVTFHDGIADMYRPHHTYVMDTAMLSSGEFKVIEYNCLNCSGKYECNRADIFKALLS